MCLILAVLLVGPVTYISPEKANNKYYSFPNDVYGAVIIFYQMIANINPYSNQPVDDHLELVTVFISHCSPVSLSRQERQFIPYLPILMLYNHQTRIVHTVGKRVRTALA